MRNSTLKKLQLPQKEWLATAVLKLIVADGNVDVGELEDTKIALGILGKALTLDTLDSLLNKTDLLEQETLYNLDYNTAYLLMSECVRCVAMNTRFSNNERKTLQNILRGLGFKSVAIRKAVAWANRLAACLNEEEQLKTIFQLEFEAPKPKEKEEK
jgi:hypothetical protein